MWHATCCPMCKITARAEQKAWNPNPTRPPDPTRRHKSDKNGKPEFRVEPDPARAPAGSGSVCTYLRWSGSGSNPTPELQSEFDKLTYILIDSEPFFLSQSHLFSSFSSSLLSPIHSAAEPPRRRLKPNQTTTPPWDDRRRREKHHHPSTSTTAEIYRLLEQVVDGDEELLQICAKNSFRSVRRTPSLLQICLSLINIFSIYIHMYLWFFFLNIYVEFEQNRVFLLICIYIYIWYTDWDDSEERVVDVVYIYMIYRLRWDENWLWKEGGGQVFGRQGRGSHWSYLLYWVERH